MFTKIFKRTKTGKTVDGKSGLSVSEYVPICNGYFFPQEDNTTDYYENETVTVEDVTDVFLDICTDQEKALAVIYGFNID